jgi:hypothetical protein
MLTVKNQPIVGARAQKGASAEGMGLIWPRLLDQSEPRRRAENEGSTSLRGDLAAVDHALDFCMTVSSATPPVGSVSILGEAEAR